MAEAKLQKLKVTELKELLVKANLPQTGKKEDLVKRLVDAGVSGDLESSDRLVDVPAPAPPAPAAQAQAPAVAPTAPQPPSVPASAPVAATSTPAAAVPDAAAVTETEPEAVELTEEQKKQKARAERFGIPFNPTKPKPAAKEVPKAAPKPEAAQAVADQAQPKVKAGAIDRAPLGISEEVLARRAAKFGLPEKKAPAATVPAPVAAPVGKVEITPEMAAANTLEEEKKRKRAEKFATVQPADESSGTEPEAKKAKV